MDRDKEREREREREGAVLIFHLDWPVKEDPHKSGFPPSEPPCQAGRTGLVGVVFCRPIQVENYKGAVRFLRRPEIPHQRTEASKSHEPTSREMLRLLNHCHNVHCGA